MSDEDETDLPESASPPCFMHELSRDALLAPKRSDAWDDVSRWRNAERRRLIDERLALVSADRIARSER
ncbi:MAG: 5-formyltetrahydrofolate cyclo-ligase, partial [Rhizobiaceae bacterium]